MDEVVIDPIINEIMCPRSLFEFMPEPEGKEPLTKEQLQEAFDAWFGYMDGLEVTQGVTKSPFPIARLVE